MIFREVSEGAILFSTDTEVYFGLNAIGVRVWNLLPPKCLRVEEVVARLDEEYPEVGADTIAADVRSLVADLVEHGLVEPA